MGSHWLTEERFVRYPASVLAIFLTVFAVWTALSLPDRVDPAGKPVGYDFITFWSAARLALEGRPEAAYDWQAIMAMHRVAVPALTETPFLWHYPPTYLLTVLPLGLLPYLVALVAFLAATTILWAALMRKLLPDPRAWLAVAAAPAGIINVMHGQNGFLTAALAGLALLSLDRRPIRAGVFIGLLAIKPHLALLFPVALAAQGRWRTFVTAAVTAFLFVGLSVTAFGLKTATAFLHNLPKVPILIDAGWLPRGMMPSGYAFALASGAPPAIAMVLQAMVALAALACVVIAWQSASVSGEIKSATLVTASLLVSPYIFYYDMTWLVLSLVWLGMAGRRTGFYRGEREVLVAAWAVPLVMVPVHAVTSVQLGFVATALVLAVATRRALIESGRPSLWPAGAWRVRPAGAEPPSEARLTPKRPLVPQRCSPIA